VALTLSENSSHTKLAAKFALDELRFLIADKKFKLKVVALLLCCGLK